MRLDLPSQRPSVSRSGSVASAGSQGRSQNMNPDDLRINLLDNPERLEPQEGEERLNIQTEARPLQTQERRFGSSDTRDGREEQPRRPGGENNTGQREGLLADLHFCNTCQVYQPFRTKHCNQCQKCVRTYDHHCCWIGKSTVFDVNL